MGSEVAGVNLSSSPSKIWLRAYANIQPGSGRTGSFYYSTNGTSFYSIRTPYTLNNTWQFFIGYQYSIFNYVTVLLGGSVLVSSFEMESGAPAFRNDYDHSHYGLAAKYHHHCSDCQGYSIQMGPVWWQWLDGPYRLYEWLGMLASESVVFPMLVSKR